MGPVNETTKILTSALGKEIVKVLILNFAATVAVFGGMAAVGAAVGKVQELKSSKKSTQTTITE